MRKIGIIVVSISLVIMAVVSVVFAGGVEVQKSDPYIPFIYRVWRDNVPGYEGTMQPVSPNLKNINGTPYEVTINELPGGLKSYSVGAEWTGGN